MERRRRRELSRREPRSTRVSFRPVMVKRRRARQERKANRGRRPQLSRWVEWKPGYSKPGSSYVLSVANIEVPRDRSYRLNSTSVQLCANGPIMVVVRLFGPEFADQAIINSGPRLVGVVPVTVNLRAPPQTDWFQRAPSPSHPLVAVDCLCPYKGDGADKNYVLINAMVHLTISPEEIPESCPALRPMPLQSLPWYRGEDAEAWETCEEQ